jgi:preprotein translocase subunit SecG
MTFLTILIVIAAILLVLLVLVQNSKGGGLAAGLSSGNQVMGAPKTADFLEKASWTLMAIIIALSIVSAGFNTTKVDPNASVVVPSETPAAESPNNNANSESEQQAEQPAEQEETKGE